MSLQSGELYITGPQLRERFGGRSDVWLWRLLRDPRVNFPKPIKLRQWRYWRLSDIEAWEASRAAESEAAA